MFVPNYIGKYEKNIDDGAPKYNSCSVYVVQALLSCASRR